MGEEHGTGAENGAGGGPPAATLALIANPASGTCDPDEIAARLRSFGAELECFGIEEIERAVGSGADRVVIAGGDGSIAPDGRGRGAGGRDAGAGARGHRQ